MALSSDAVMVLFYDIEGNTADHDDWHSYEHFHERLSVPGFLRATRWVNRGEGPRYLVTYEVSGVDVATSPAYLDRLNDPTPWTSAMMPRFRGMTRGFCEIVASDGFGFGATAAAMRFQPELGAEARLAEWLARDVLPAMASWRGVTSVQVLQPAPPPPMTREQSLRGPDAAMPWLVIATAYDEATLCQAMERHLAPAALRENGAAEAGPPGYYSLHHTATADEVARTPARPPLAPDMRKADGPR